jgi:hypothetical protein
MSGENMTGNQSDRFKEAARDALCDEDKARWEAKLREVAKRKPPLDKRSAE